MPNELLYLAYAAMLTGVLWIPYVVDRLVVRGVRDTVGYPLQPKPQSPWAVRLMKAHANAVENLAVFATLMLVAHSIGASAGVLATAGAIYFWARVVHAAAYALAIPWVRTLAFAAGFAAQAVVAWQIVAR